MNVTVLVATYGTTDWKARGRVLADRISRTHEVPAIAVHTRGDSPLGAARNRAVDVADGLGYAGDWLCFVDADDDLDPGYFPAIDEAITAADAHGSPPTWNLYTPAVRTGADGPVVVHSNRDISHLNPCVIGTVLHRTLFDAVDRFWDEPAWEDWSLFRRCWLYGADIVHVPAAIYQDHAHPNGRNSTVQHPSALHRTILASHRTWIASRP